MLSNFTLKLILRLGLLGSLICLRLFELLQLEQRERVEDARRSVIERFFDEAATLRRAPRRGDLPPMTHGTRRVT
jgi:hypothetical protein